MKQFKKVETTTTINEDMKTETHTTTTLHTIRSWQELSKEEQEEEIKRQQENIYMLYQEDLYNNFLADLDYLKEQFKNIEFENIYLDSNSQGWWVDSVKDFRYNTQGIEVYGEYIEIDDIDLHIRKYIDSFDINIYDYGIDSDKLEKIKKTKKYKNWYSNIEKDIQEWVNLANEYCSDIGNKEFYCPYNLDDDEDKEWLDNYFESQEFEEIKILK